MSVLISDLVPLNLAAERVKFFAGGGQSNPRFQYLRPVEKSQLQTFGWPQPALVKRAETYLAHHQPIAYPNETPLTHAQLIEQVQDLCKRLQIKPVKIVFPREQTITLTLQDQTLKVRQNFVIYPSRLQRSLRHELETHLLRRLNEAKQPWASTARPRELWLRTEEGLAIYNSDFGRPANLYKTALLYLLVDLARGHDFVTVYQTALRYLSKPESAFVFALRVKRGLTDTSQPGGFTKDLVYFEGYHQVKTWLAQPNHHYADLYWGKIDTSEVETLRTQVQWRGLVYPTFMPDPEQAYVLTQVS
jgi:hypothetical protein